MTTETAVSAANHRRDVVFTFSTETLADAAARGFARPPGRMLQTLAHSDRVGKLLVVDAPRWIPAKLRRGSAPWPSGLGSQRPHFRPGRIGRREPTHPDEVIASMRQRDRALRKRADKLQLNRPAVISFDPLFAGFADLSWAGPVTYYGRDDWASFPARKPWWPAYELAYEQLRKRSRGVLTVSQQLLDRIAPTGPGVVIPNGIDPEEWRSPAASPEWFSSLERPVYTYVGTVDDRIDESLLTALASGPGTVLLVGPCRDDELRKRLRSAGATLGVADDRAELSAIVFHSDVGLIPHQRTELTEAMSPLKLYEYRAAGLPVASVDLPPIAAEAADDSSILLAIESESSAFAECARAAAVIGRTAESARLAYVDAASWSGRHEAALEIILRP